MTGDIAHPERDPLIVDDPGIEKVTAHVIRRDVGVVDSERFRVIRAGHEVVLNLPGLVHLVAAILVGLGKRSAHRADLHRQLVQFRRGGASGRSAQFAPADPPDRLDHPINRPRHQPQQREVDEGGQRHADQPDHGGTPQQLHLRPLADIARELRDVDDQSVVPMRSHKNLMVIDHPLMIGGVMCPSHRFRECRRGAAVGLRLQNTIVDPYRDVMSG